MKGLFFILLIIVCVSCKTTRYTQKEYYSTDTLTQIRYMVDSVHVHDSIITFLKGDTVLIEKWHTAYGERIRVDTVEKVKTEVKVQTKTVTETREVNRLKWWQKALMWTGVFCLAFGVLRGVSLIKKLGNKE